MSAIARFLVEFEPSPSASPWPAPYVAPSDPPLDGDSIADLDQVGFGGDPDTVLLEPNDTFELASTDPSLADTAVAEALAAAEAGFSERIATLEEEHARARADDRTRWVETEGPALAEAFRKAVAGIEEHIGEAVAAVLEPMMAEVLKAAALLELRQTVSTLTASGSTATIEVAGAEDLVEAFRTALDAAGHDTAGMVFTTSQDAEVTVTADNSTIRTRLAEWAVCFEGSLRSDA